jgi:hypothetical protein
MGWGKAAQNTDAYTRMAMMAQIGQAQQAQKALEQGQAQSAEALRQSQAQAVQGYQPYQQFGTESTNRLATLMGLRPGEGSGSLMEMPTMAQLQMDPSYAFRERQGMQALQNSAAARGGLLSGNTLKGIQDYSQGLASTEYGNAYNRFMANRANQVAMLQGGVGTGMNAAQGAGNAYLNTGSNLANVYGNVGQQLAANYNQMGQNIGQGYANIGSAYAQSAMAPTNLMAALAGQAIQSAGSLAGMNYARTGKFLG